MKKTSLDKYLTLLADDYKTLLENRLIEISDPLDDLSIWKLMQIDSETKKALIPYYNTQKRRRRYLSIISLCFSITGSISLIILQFSDFSTIVSKVSLAFSVFMIISGAIFSNFIELDLFPKVFNVRRFKQNSIENRELQNIQVLKLWRELESLVADRSKDSDVYSVADFIKFVKRDGFLSDDESLTLLQLRELRNEVVHGVNTKYKENDVANIIAKANLVVAKLR